MHGLGTLTNIIDRRTNQAVIQIDDAGGDNSCRTRYSPYTRA